MNRFMFALGTYVIGTRINLAKLTVKVEYLTFAKTLSINVINV